MSKIKDFRYNEYELTGYLADRELTQTISVPFFLTSMRKYCLSNIKCEGIELSTRLTLLNKSVIYNCPNLKTVRIFAYTHIISPDFYENCPNLENIEINEHNKSYSSVDGFVFNQEKNLHICPKGKSGVITIPEGPTKLDTTIFSGCNKITTIILPHSLTTLIINDLDKIPLLEKIVVQENVSVINNSFFRTNNEKVKIEISSNNPNYKVINKCIYNMKENSLVYIDKEYDGCVNIEPFTKKIYSWCFQHRNFSSLVVPENIDFEDILDVTNKGRYDCNKIFNNCKNLVKIDFKKRDAKIYAKWFTDEFSFEYLINKNLCKVFQTLLSNIYPNQLEIEELEISLKWIVNYLTKKTKVDYTKEWEEAWMNFFAQNYKKYSDLLLKNCKLVTSLTKEKRLSLTAIKYLVANSEKNNYIDSKAILLQYENDNFNEEDLLKEKEKDFEKMLEYSLGI